MKQEGEKCGCCDQCLPTLTKGRCADGLICHKPGFLNICETYGRCRKAGGEYLHNHLLKKLTLMSHNIIINPEIQKCIEYLSLKQQGAWTNWSFALILELIASLIMQKRIAKRLVIGVTKVLKNLK